MMTAPQRIDGFPLPELLEGLIRDSKVPDINICGLSCDSRLAGPGDLFFAVPGSLSHGIVHGEEAISKGAAVVLYDPESGGEEIAENLRRDFVEPVIPQSNLRQAIGLIADRFYDQPSSKLDVIGITGTNGKTSCSHFMAQALGDTHRAAVIGTLGWGFVGHTKETRNTTPDSITIHDLLVDISAQGAKSAILEVSSHALVQGRVQGVRFRGAIYTNISRDHLDYHGTMDAYVGAKLRLLQADGLQFLVVNFDDDSVEKILAEAPAGLRVIGASQHSNSFAGLPCVMASGIRHDQQGLSFQVKFGEESCSVETKLIGEFNVVNLLSVIAALVAMDHPFVDACRRVAHVSPVPGRMQCIDSGADSPKVVVDYAHTPQALEVVLQSIRKHCTGDIWLVFGCGGERDRGKRAQMGRIAEQLADRVIVTDDNPRNESGDAIVNDIVSGCKGDGFQITRDRRQAIEVAIAAAAPDDLVLIAGKGHETRQEIRGGEYAFSDIDVAQPALLKRGQRGVQ